MDLFIKQKSINKTEIKFAKYQFDYSLSGTKNSLKIGVTAKGLDETDKQKNVMEQNDYWLIFSTQDLKIPFSSKIYYRFEPMICSDVVSYEYRLTHNFMIKSGC